MLTTPEFYVYTHRRATDGQVFYVGKGRGRRAFERSRGNPHWHNVVNKHGLEVVLVATGLDEETAFDTERQLISFYRSIGLRLANMTDGGEGASGYRFSEIAKERKRASQRAANARPEVKARRSVAARDKWQDPEFHAQVSAIQKEAQNRPAVLLKQRAAQKRNQARPDIKARHREGLRRFWDGNPDAKAQRGAAAIAAFKDPAVRQKHKAAIQQAAKDPALRAVRSVNAKALWQDPEYRERMMVKRKAAGARRRQEKQAAAAAACSVNVN